MDASQHPTHLESNKRENFGFSVGIRWLAEACTPQEYGDI